MHDVMDGQYYARLCQEHVVIDGVSRNYKFFEDGRDMMLGLSTDGFAPFRWCKKTCWPMFIFNYNLPPELRCLLKYILCIGIFLGPKKPKDWDSFAWPLVQELVELALGVKTFDISSQEFFMLCAYLLLVFGDIPAMSMVMCMKGHNGIVPCHFCKIVGIRIPGQR